MFSKVWAQDNLENKQNKVSDPKTPHKSGTDSTKLSSDLHVCILAHGIMYTHTHVHTQ